jgi:AcrR family transcriptional regulator
VTMAERLADAAMVVIARDGLDALSVRRVAREIPVTGGTVQHHFPTKVELTVAALDRCVLRQSSRLTRAVGGAGEIDRMVQRLGGLLPFDDERRVETVVWIAMSAAVSGQAEIEARHRAAVSGMRRWIARSIERAQSAGEVRPGLDPGEAAQMIEAGLDGMMLAGISESYAWNRRARERFDLMVRRIVLLDPATTTTRSTPAPSIPSERQAGD